jgi:hypothetical protein
MSTLQDVDKRMKGSGDEDVGSDDELRQVGSATESEEESEERKHKPAYVPPEDIDLGDKWVLRDVKADRDAPDSDSEPGSDREDLDETLASEDGDAEREEVTETVADDVSSRTLAPHSC